MNRATKIRHDTIRIGMTFAALLIICNGLMLLTGVQLLPLMVVSGSMEPGIKRGDVVFLHLTNDHIRTGDVVVFKIEGSTLPIVHRVIEVHERQDSEEIDILTKGDNNRWDDRALYARGQLWLQRHHIMGRAVGYLPYFGWIRIIMTENPIVKMLQDGIGTTPHVSWEM